MLHLRRIFAAIILATTLLVITTCQTDVNEVDQVANSISMEQYASSANGMISTSHPLATAAGLEILEKGGNAADAAVAAAFALGVVEPEMSGIGGRLQAIIWSTDGKVHGIDATTQAPMTYDQQTAPQAKYGYAVIGIPGMLAGLEKLNKEHGSLAMEELLAPAIKYAEEGFYLMPGQASRQASVQNMLVEFEGSRHYYIKANDTLTYGSTDLLVQRDLAQTLRAIAASGADAFYRGEIGEKMVADIQAHGGAVTLESLNNYEAKDATVLVGSYRGHDVYGLWMPSFGAITIEILQILENLPMAEYTEAEWASAMYQALNIAYEDRYTQTSLEVGEHLIDKNYARELAARIHVGNPVEVGYTVFEQEEYLAYSNELGHTTHLSVADKNGMIISLTQSLGPLMGSRVVTPGLGFLYAATLGGYLGPMEPGQRAASHISPMILAAKGEPFIGIGAAGGAKINSAIVQAISRIVDRDMELLEALAAPRVHPLRESMSLEVPDSLSWNPEDYQFLRDNGFVIEEENRPFRFGRVHVVMKSEAKWLGAADPDGEGAAAGPKR